MFGRKKKENNSMVMQPNFQNDEYENPDMINKAFNYQNQNQVPNVPNEYRNMNQPYPRQVPNQNQGFQNQMNQTPQVQQVQQVQQPQLQARILRIEISEQGTYYHLVEANYQLKLGDCQLVQ